MSLCRTVTLTLFVNNRNTRGVSSWSTVKAVTFSHGLPVGHSQMRSNIIGISSLRLVA